jgi:hypothetical protein
MNATVRLRETAAANRMTTPPAASDDTRARLEIARPMAAETRSASRNPEARRRWLDPAWLAFLATAALLYWGYYFPTEQYITPQSGVGYALGIIGGSAMLLLLLYPARKRLRGLKFLGTTKRWFQTHMVLGIVGPVLVLFHSNFSLGATNSNVALACMLVVSGSGLFGRYFYTRIHHGLHGRKANLTELKDYAEKLRWVTTNVEFLPDLVTRIESEEHAIVGRCERLPLLARPPVCAASVLFARRRLRRYVRRSLHGSTSHGDVPHRKQGLLATAGRYIDDRLSATRRVVEFAAFERLFSLWHALHLPLFVMLLIAGVVHVIAVHVY